MLQEVCSEFTTQSLLWGLALGCLLMMVIMGYSARKYRAILLDIARHGGCERLPDGKFYYIVAESQYVEMMLAQRKDEQSARVSQQALTDLG